MSLNIEAAREMTGNRTQQEAARQPVEGQTDDDAEWEKFFRNLSLPQQQLMQRQKPGSNITWQQYYRQLALQQPAAGQTDLPPECQQ